MTPADILAHLQLARAEGGGTQTWRRLLERFGTARAALEALPRYGRGNIKPPEAGEVRRTAPARTTARAPRGG